MRAYCRNSVAYSGMDCKHFFKNFRLFCISPYGKPELRIKAVLPPFSGQKGGPSAV